MKAAASGGTGPSTNTAKKSNKSPRLDVNTNSALNIQNQEYNSEQKAFDSKPMSARPSGRNSNNGSQERVTPNKK